MLIQLFNKIQLCLITPSFQSSEVYISGACIAIVSEGHAPSPYTGIASGQSRSHTLHATGQAFVYILTYKRFNVRQYIRLSKKKRQLDSQECSTSINWCLITQSNAGEIRIQNTPGTFLAKSTTLLMLGAMISARFWNMRHRHTSRPLLRSNRSSLISGPLSCNIT